MRQGHARPCRFGVSARVSSQVLAFALTAGLVCATPAAAFAEVLQTDEILSQSVAQRGLAESECPDVEAENALLIGTDGTVYFARDAHEAVKIASITKVMTAIVALENASLDTQVVVDEEAATVGESSAGLQEGDTMSLETALYAMMIPSGNDASIAIAKAVGELLPDYDGQDAEAAFVAAMNAKAVELGCEDTLYTNPHGLDADEFASDCHSTASDVGIVVAYAMKNETFRKIVDAGDTTITVSTATGGARDIALISTDELIGVYDGICGVKTGTTDEAGYCFAGAVSRTEGEYYSVVLGSPTSEERFTDTTELFDWVYENIVQKRLINVTSHVNYQNVQSPLVARVAHTEWTDATVPATVAEPDLTAVVFAADGSIEQTATYEELTGDIHEGDVIGKLTFTQNGTVVAECDLIAAKDQQAPNIFQKVGVFFDRLVRGFQDQPTVAESVLLNSTDAIADL